MEVGVSPNVVTIRRQERDAAGDRDCRGKFYHTLRAIHFSHVESQVQKFRYELYEAIFIENYRSHLFDLVVFF